LVASEGLGTGFSGAVSEAAWSVGPGFESAAFPIESIGHEMLPPLRVNYAGTGLGASKIGSAGIGGRSRAIWPHRKMGV